MGKYRPSVHDFLGPLQSPVPNRPISDLRDALSQEASRLLEVSARLSPARSRFLALALSSFAVVKDEKEIRSYFLVFL